jgi:hypothetical protein
MLLYLGGVFVNDTVGLQIPSGHERIGVEVRPKFLIKPFLTVRVARSEYVELFSLPLLATLP